MFTVTNFHKNKILIFCHLNVIHMHNIVTYLFYAIICLLSVSGLFLFIIIAKSYYVFSLYIGLSCLHLIIIHVPDLESNSDSTDFVFYIFCIICVSLDMFYILLIFFIVDLWNVKIKIN